MCAPVFYDIKWKIHGDPFYLGESRLDHYAIHMVGYSRTELSLPAVYAREEHKGLFYAVATGRKLGIFLTW